MRFLRILFRKYIDNRIHIALTAPALMWLWSRLLDCPFRFVDYVILTLVSAFICQWNRLTDEKEDRINCPEDLEIAIRDRRWIKGYCYVVAASAITLLVVTTTDWLVSASLLLAFALGFFYSTPLLPGKSSKRIKDIFLFKNLSSGIGWSIGVALYPALRSGCAADGKLLMACLYMAMSATTYEIIWDMRDVRGDREAGVGTFPVILGLAATKRIVLGLQALVILLIAAGLISGRLRMIWIFLVLHSLMLVWTAFRLGEKLPSSRMLTQMMVIATIFFSLLVGVLALYRP
jgi:4-hydroxybenzoate polyprenyltransferase